MSSPSVSTFSLEINNLSPRVLHMDTSPDGSTVVSAAADETLRFWDMFGSPPHAKARKEAGHGGAGSLSSMHNLR